MDNGTFFIVGLIVLAIAVGFHIQSITVPFMIIGGGFMFMAALDGMLNYLDKKK
jgi:hypothetical protein